MGNCSKEWISNGNNSERIHSMKILRVEIVMTHTAYTRWTEKKSWNYESVTHWQGNALSSKSDLALGRAARLAKVEEARQEEDGWPECLQNWQFESATRPYCFNLLSLYLKLGIARRQESSTNFKISCGVKNNDGLPRAGGVDKLLHWSAPGGGLQIWGKYNGRKYKGMQQGICGLEVQGACDRLVWFVYIKYFVAAAIILCLSESGLWLLWEGGR